MMNSGDQRTEESRGETKERVRFDRIQPEIYGDAEELRDCDVLPVDARHAVSGLDQVLDARVNVGRLLPSTKWKVLLIACSMVKRRCAKASRSVGVKDVFPPKASGVDVNQARSLAAICQRSGVSIPGEPAQPRDERAPWPRPTGPASASVPLR